MRGKRRVTSCKERRSSQKDGEKPIMGWSEYTRLHRGDVNSSQSDLFPLLQPSPSTTSHAPSQQYQQQQRGSQTLPHAFSVVVSGHKLDHQPPSSTLGDELRSLYKWADKDLIQDVLACVGGEKKRAMEWLDSMAATMTASEAVDAASASAALEKGAMADEEDGMLERISGMSLDEAVLAREETESCCDAVEGAEDCGLERGKEAKIGGLVTKVPVEAEWKQDDPYLASRCDALRAARAAQRHARGAVHAFNVGDHRRAKVLSAKAQEEHIHAQTLNAKAAVEIFRIKNVNRDIWSLDLHGLHASEAVDALEGRLLEIEFARRPSLFSGPYKKIEENFDSRRGIVQNDGGVNLNCTNQNMQAPGVLAVNFSTNKELTVITGSGTHSRGSATLPKTVKDYLVTNRYQFYEPRTGIIIIRPKR